MYVLPRLGGGRNFLKKINTSLSQYVKIFCNVVRHGGYPLHKHLRWLLRRGSPLPIPNREVKPACADGTAICGRVCRRLSFENPSSIDEGFFVLFLKVNAIRWESRWINLKSWGGIEYILT